MNEWVNDWHTLGTSNRILAKNFLNFKRPLRNMTSYLAAAFIQDTLSSSNCPKSETWRESLFVEKKALAADFWTKIKMFMSQRQWLWWSQSQWWQEVTHRELKGANKTSKLLTVMSTTRKSSDVMGSRKEMQSFCQAKKRAWQRKCSTHSPTTGWIVGRVRQAG